MKRTEVTEVRIGYLGPQGSHSHDVTVSLNPSCSSGEENMVPLNPQSFEDAFSKGIITKAVLPLENIVGGQVNWVIDLLINTNQSITQETIWPINNHLLSYGQISEVREVYSNSQPLAQCQQWLRRMPFLLTSYATSSTSAAVELVAKKRDPRLAAIGTASSAKIYNVPVLAENIDDCKNNKTRFIVLGGKEPLPTGRDKTSLIIGTANQPGALLKALKVFEALNININTLLSMPSKDGKFGEYLFFIDIDGHRKEGNVCSALKELSKTTEFLKALGSYPKAINEAGSR